MHIALGDRSPTQIVGVDALLLYFPGRGLTPSQKMRFDREEGCGDADLRWWWIGRGPAVMFTTSFPWLFRIRRNVSAPRSWTGDGKKGCKNPSTCSMKHIFRDVLRIFRIRAARKRWQVSGRWPLSDVLRHRFRLMGILAELESNATGSEKIHLEELQKSREDCFKKTDQRKGGWNVPFFVTPEIKSIHYIRK